MTAPTYPARRIFEGSSYDDFEDRNYKYRAANGWEMLVGMTMLETSPGWPYYPETYEHQVQYLDICEQYGIKCLRRVDHGHGPVAQFRHF